MIVRLISQEMENLRVESEEGKKATVSQLAKLEEAMKTRDREMDKLDEQVANKKQAGRSQDEEVIKKLISFFGCS